MDEWNGDVAICFKISSGNDLEHTHDILRTILLINAQVLVRLLSESSIDFWGGANGLVQERVVTVDNVNLTSAQPIQKRFAAFRLTLSEALAAMKVILYACPRVRTILPATSH